MQALKAGLNYKMQGGIHKGMTIQEIIDSDLQYIDYLHNSGKLMIDAEALIYMINKRQEKIEKLSLQCDKAREREDL